MRPRGLPGPEGSGRLPWGTLAAPQCPSCRPTARRPAWLGARWSTSRAKPLLEVGRAPLYHFEPRVGRDPASAATSGRNPLRTLASQRQRMHALNHDAGSSEDSPGDYDYMFHLFIVSRTRLIFSSIPMRYSW